LLEDQTKTNNIYILKPHFIVFISPNEAESSADYSLGYLKLPDIYETQTSLSSSQETTIGFHHPTFFFRSLF
jgi:hypothetical protein